MITQFNVQFPPFYIIHLLLGDEVCKCSKSFIEQQHRLFISFCNLLNLPWDRIQERDNFVFPAADTSSILLGN